MFAPLSPHEETTLRKIAGGNVDPIDPVHVRRLRDLGLVDETGTSWHLTPLGARRHEQLAHSGPATASDASLLLKARA
jgi:hypothetical protein